jgi:hypothetical protein
VALSHPANWSQYKLDLLRDAARLAGIDDVAFVAEPTAAALHHAASRPGPDGRCYLVYDLGGGTFDVAVVGMEAAGPPGAPGGGQLRGRPDGLERLGGIDFDEALRGVIERLTGTTLAAVDVSDPSALRGVARFRADLVAAKEALSVETSVEVPLFVPGLPPVVRVTRGELEEAISHRVADTMAITERVIAAAALSAEEAATLTVLLVGGSSRIPLVGRMVAERLHLPTALDEHPKHPVALGAARLAAASPVGAAALAGAAAVQGAGGADGAGAAGAILVSPGPVAGAADGPARGPRPGTPWYRRPPLAAAVAVAAATVLLAGLAMTWRNGGGGGTAGAEPKTIQAISTLADPATTYTSPIAQLADGLVVSRSWTLRASELTGTLMVFNASGGPLSTELEEVFPRSLVRTLDDVTFSPPPDHRIEAELVAVYRITDLAAGASQEYRYALPVPSSDDPAEARLEGWDRERAAQAEQRGGGGRVTLAEIVLAQPAVELDAGASAQVALTGRMSDGQPAGAAVLAAVAVESGDAAVATAASTPGAVTVEGRREGATVVSVRSGQAGASLAVTVRPPRGPASSPTTEPPVTSPPAGGTRPGGATPSNPMPPPPATQPPPTTVPPPTAAPTTTAPPPPPPAPIGVGPGSYEEDRATYSTGWSTCSAPLGQSGGCDMWTSTAGQSYEIRFHGTGIVIYGAKAFNGGRMSFTVDGVHAATADSYYDGNPQRRIDGAEYYRVSGLDNTNHTLVARMLTDRNPANTQPTIYVTLDRFDVLG